MRAILTYHSIDATGSVISVDPAIFRSHVEFLASGRMKVVELAAIESVAPNEDAVAITFDDGFENFATEAFPSLRDHALPATVFVVSDHVGENSAWEGDHSGINAQPLMSWETLGDIAQRRIEIGAHSRTHKDLTTLSTAEQQNEIVGSRERIAAKLGAAPKSFAYPYGKLTPESVDIAERVFDRSCTTELRLFGDREHRSRLPRIDMYYFREPGQLESWGTPAFARRLWVRAQGRRVKEFASHVGMGTR